MTVKFIIEGYRWFDKVNGNTYHTVYITDTRTNKLIFNSNYMVYGYNDQYRHTALDELIKMGKFKEEDRFNHDYIRKYIYFNVTDVSRKKDLF